MPDASDTTAHVLPNPTDPDTPILSVNMTEITKLTATNYIAWSLQVRLFLGGHAFSSFIDATATTPPATITTDTVVSSNPKYISWIRQDQLIFASLLGTISPPLQSLVTSASTTFEAWTILAKTYGTPSRGHIKQLKDQLKKSTKGSRTIDDFMQLMKAKADELSLLGKPVDQEDLIEFIIDGLPEEYRALCDAIQNRDTPISFEEFHEKLRNREADVLCRVSPVEVFPATAQVTNFRQRPSNNNTWQPSTPLVSNEEGEEEVSSESESEEEEPDPKPDSSSEEDESDDEEEVTPVKPVVVVQSPKVREKQQPDLAPASAVRFGKKRPAGESKAADGNVTKKLKKVDDKRPGYKSVAEDVVKKSLFQRVFSEKDEIAMLKAVFDYSANKCIDPIKDIADFHDFVKKSIHADVTSAQLSAKIQKMKSKYKKKASQAKDTFGKAHDQSCYDLSKKIWGKGKRIPKMKNMTPGLQIPQVVEEPVREKNISLSELAKTRDVVGLMCLSDDTFKKNLELLSNDEARAALEDKLKNIVTAEVELTYKRLDLSRELMKSSLDGHRG